MVSVDAALLLIETHSLTTTKREKIQLSSAVRRVLSEDIYSPIDMPPFRQSAMDGYALNLSIDKSYNLVGEIKAGDGHSPTLRSGEAVRIFTGALVPETATAVVMQEKVISEEGKITLNDTCTKGMNIRALGEQITKGSIAVKKGEKLTPAAVGFLASLGVVTVEVRAKPTISLIVTGNELAEAGQPLPYGKVYESNSTMLLSVLKGLKYHVTIYKVGDDFYKIKEIIEKAILNSDIVVVTGGISVGDYDFSGKVLKDIGVTPVFYKVKQKPGKPLYFGVSEEGKPIFALPGNPASALSCFYIYVYPFLQNWEGDRKCSIKTISFLCLSDFTKKKGYTQFLKAKIEKYGVKILEGQSSAMLHTYAQADALVIAPEDKSDIRKGDYIDVMVLPS